MWSFEIGKFDLYFLFYNFILYSFFGWIYESTFVSIKNKALINRGFLNGPIIPIYGAGATIVYMFLEPVQNRASYVFVGGMLIATTLEYITSYIMEKLFHAKWWDYSNAKYNIKGRICPLASLFWGFLSILMTDIFQPFINQFIDKVPRESGEKAGIAIGLLVLSDFVVTVVYTVQWDKKISDLARIRHELMEYIEGTKLYETKEEIKNRLENFSLPAFTEWVKEFLDEKTEKYNLVKTESLDTREEMESRIQTLIKKYQNRAELRTFVENRFLKAFPSLKFTKNQSVLKDIKAYKNRKKDKED